jgi:hypothetical protein
MSVALMDLPELTAIHDRFLSLSRVARERFGDSAGGRLVLRNGLDADGIAVIIAASVAGAASLCVEAEGDRLREGLRAGSVDFVVANLDEALRILKNEIRRAQPVSVGLTGDPEAHIDAMIERGLQPDLHSAIPQRQASLFTERGAISLAHEVAPHSEMALVEWSVSGNPARSMAHIAGLASEALDAARGDTPERRRWLEHSPRYLGRAFGSKQCVRMTEPERAEFMRRAGSEVPAAKITRHGDKP